MKQKITKVFNLLISSLMIVTALTTNILPVAAEGNTTESDENLDTIQELGPLYDVFPQLSAANDGISTMETTGVGEHYAKIYLDNLYGFDYISYMTVADKVVFCIEPMAVFEAGNDYHEDTIAWDNLSETQRQKIWEINYYGYSYPGHQTTNYYIATQLMIWEVVDQWYQPYTVDGSSTISVDNEINTINSLRSQPQGRPSFNNQTIKTGLNTPVTITDSKGTLGNYSINSGKGVSVSKNGNSLTLAITSEDYDSNITFNRNFSARDVNIIYGNAGQQRVIYLASRRDPAPNFKLNFELLYADIEVEKQDVDTGNKTQGDATFDGAVFQIQDTNGKVLETITTDGSKVKSKKYPVGTSYKIVEVTPPTGYLSNDAVNNVTLTSSGDNTPETFKTIYTDKVIKGRIELAKSIEQETQNPLESVIQKPGVGFKFDVFLKSSGKKITTLTTDKNGRAMSELLPYGRYIVKEQNSTGYDTLKPFEVMIDENEKVYFYNIYNNKLKAELNIYKTDAETGNRIPAADVEFKIKDADGNYVKQTVTYPNKYETDVFKTDEEGSVHLPEPLIFGKYSIVEIKAPYGYVLKDTEIPFNIDGSSTEIFMNFDNQSQKGQITVEKYGEQFIDADFRGTEYGIMYSPIYENRNLAGVTYEIHAKDDIIGQEGTVWYKQGDLVETIITNADGTITSQKLPLGSYTLQEVETIQGYVLDNTIYDVNIEYEGQLVEVVQKNFTLNNERQKLDLQLTKSFEDEDINAYKDVRFGIYSNDDIKIGNTVVIPKDGLLGVITIDKDGHSIEQFDLPVGNYYVKELETNVGYVLDENKYEFTYTNTEDTTKATAIVKLDEIKNAKRRLTLEVAKVDKDHHDHFLNGAIFKVTDKSNNHVTFLASGQLMIKDTKSDQEYEISTDKEFGSIFKKEKTDSLGEIILDVADGTYYSRKVGSNDIQEHIIKDGKAILVDAIYGHEYEFEEIKAPASYHKADKAQTYKVIADKKHNTVYFSFENKRIEIPNTGI